MAPRIVKNSWLVDASKTSKSSPVKEMARSLTAKTRGVSSCEMEEVEESGGEYGRDVWGVSFPPESISIASSSRFIWREEER